MSSAGGALAHAAFVVGARRRLASALPDHRRATWRRWRLLESLGRSSAGVRSQRVYRARSGVCGTAAFIHRASPRVVSAFAPCPPFVKAAPVERIHRFDPPQLERKGSSLDKLRITSRRWAVTLGGLALLVVALATPVAAELPRGDAERSIDLTGMRRNARSEPDPRSSVCTWQSAARHVAGWIAKVLLRTAHSPIHGL